MGFLNRNDIYIKRSSTLKFLNGLGKVLKKTGLDPFKLDAGSIISKARKKAEYNEPLPGQTETGLIKLVDSVKKEAGANAFGLLASKTLFEQTLYGRLKVEQVIKQNPGIEKEEIKEPVFIIGMPRTGTTILHALMYRDNAHRSPLAWECLLPYPPPVPETYYDNPQIRKVEKTFEQLFKLVPDFKVKHYMEATEPQECLAINFLDFNSFQPVAQFYIPSYYKWFMEKADKLETMRFHKRFLQYLQSGGVKAERWLLKTPVHLMRLPELFEVYPDARIIVTHRHPSKIVASTASLISSVRSLYGDEENPERTGHEQADIWSDYFNRFLESRKKLNKEDQIIDIKFDDFVKDQVGTVKSIYEHFGWKLTDKTVEKFKRFLKENPKDKNGAHIYSLEEFGLTGKDIEEKYAVYIDFLSKL